MHRVTLYVPCHNGARYIRKCIEGVLQQRYPVEEIFIIDDGSTDTSAAIASGYPVRIVRHGVRKGLASARNTGVMCAQTDFVASLDADCVAAPEWLEIVMRNFSDENIAGVGGRLLEACLDSDADQWRARYMKQHLGEERLVNPAFFAGSNTVFRKRCIVEAGMYDAQFKTNFEDYDMCTRLRQKGFGLIYEPCALAYHLRHDRVMTVLNTHWRWSFWGAQQNTPPTKALYMYSRTRTNVLSTYGRMRVDFMERRLNLLFIDFSFFFHHLFLDFKYYIGHALFRSFRNSKA